MGVWMKIVHKRALIRNAHASPELRQGDLAAWVKTTYKLRSAPARNTVSNILKIAAATLSDKYSDENRDYLGLSRRSRLRTKPSSCDGSIASYMSRLLSRRIPTPLTSSKLCDEATRFGKKSVERIPSRTVSGTQTSATWSPRTKRAMPLSAATARV
ncbi:unnamed protein product [Phytophthora fragariaefolia]|uniref:Unnamed protein product n=1 Tax=Phytophthora fragariaefolia TaxID=1490495 RepID=A0A9W6XMQ4_9STRA|nr:unnamed protein product [Phytophthora fragariaefolia]